MDKENNSQKMHKHIWENDFFQKKIWDNIGLKLLSLLVAAVVWMIIINIDDPYKVKTFNVEVETINADALESVNKVYEIVEGNIATVKVTGKKSVVDKLHAEDIRATADLSNLSAVNAVNIVPSLRKNVAYEPTLECNQVLKVSLENMATKQVKVTVITEGTPEDGFSIGECTAKPNMVEVSGGESAVNSIDSVKVTLNVNGVNQEFSRRLKPIAYDNNGDVVDSSTLSYNVSKVRVTAQVLETKKIPLKIDITGQPADGYEFVEADCLPEKIEVAGTAKKLSTISSVTIPININGMKSNSSAVEQNISIQDYLQDGVNVLSDYALVSLKITIEKQVKKSISINVDKIKLLNLQDGYNSEILGDASGVEIVVRGRASVLESLPDSAYTAYVDCESLTPGKYRLPVEVDLGSTCTLVESEEVQVRITKQKETNGTTISTMSPTVTSEPTSTPDSIDSGADEDKDDSQNSN